jgi:Xaa-Pro aminopeptidase
MDLPFYDKGLLATDRVIGHHGTPEAFKGVAEALNALRVNGKVAVCGTDFLPHNAGRHLEQTCAQIEFAEEDDLTLPMHMIKSGLELDCYRHAGEIVRRALNRLIEGLVRGKTEAEAAADAAYEVTRAGGRFHMIPVSHGDTIMDWNRNPLAGFSEDAPRTGDMVRGWVYGPIYQGYWLDPGRTAIAGPIGVSGDREQKRVIEATANIVDTLIAGVRPGVKQADLVALGTKLWREGKRIRRRRCSPSSAMGSGSPGSLPPSPSRPSSARRGSAAPASSRT